MSKEQQQEDLIESFTDFSAEYPQSALALISGLFVGLLEHTVSEQGGDPMRKIVMEGDEGQRSITVHGLGEQA